ncbi:hypothetical protein [Streptomyces sp. NPDC002845]
MTRHGRVARTPVSPRDPALLTAALPEPRSTTRGSGRETAHRDELARLAESLLSEPTVRNLWRQQLSLTRIFDWLEGFPADTWQDRWLLSGSDDLGSGWGPRGLSAGTRSRFTAGLGTLIVLQAIRPSYGWLFGSRLLGVYDAYRRHNQQALFAELKQRAGGQRCDEHATEALNVLTRMSIVTGKDLMAFDLEDLTDYAGARQDNGRTVTALPLAYDILHAVGGLKDSPPTLREAQARGQLTPAELIDRHPIANRAVRDVLVHYLAERSAVLDYGSLVNHAQMLADLFWGDLQRHHPTISSLNLPDEVAQAWKQRVRVPARRATAPHRPRRVPGRPLLLPGPLAVVDGGPCPLGGLGGTLPDQRGRHPRLHQGDPAQAGANAAAHPHPGPRPAAARPRCRGPAATCHAAAAGSPLREAW